MWAGLKPVEFEEYKSELESSGNTRQEIKHLMPFILKGLRHGILSYFDH